MTKSPLPPFHKGGTKLRPNRSIVSTLGWDALLPDATPLGAVRDGTADGVNDIVGDKEVGVCPLRPKGVVARQPQFLAALPPPVRGGDDPGMQGMFASRLQPD